MPTTHEHKYTYSRCNRTNFQVDNKSFHNELRNRLELPHTSLCFETYHTCFSRRIVSRPPCLSIHRPPDTIRTLRGNLDQSIHGDGHLHTCMYNYQHPRHHHLHTGAHTGTQTRQPRKYSAPC